MSNLEAAAAILTHMGEIRRILHEADPQIETFSAGIVFRHAEESNDSDTIFFFTDADEDGIRAVEFSGEFTPLGGDEDEPV